jgi:hypothetical protein
MMKNWPYENVYMDNHAYHAFNIADIASETPAEERQKIYVHEKIACSYKSQLHFQSCNVVPVLVGEFSLAIDNCMPHLDARYADFGQCRDVASRLTSPWWNRHIKSFAMRQIATAERELGWAFWTYKMDATVEATDPSAYFWSFRLAAKKGFIDKSFYGRRDACTYAPVDDFVLGDQVNSMGAAQSAPTQVDAHHSFWDSKSSAASSESSSQSTPASSPVNTVLSNSQLDVSVTSVMMLLSVFILAAAVVALRKRDGRRDGSPYRLVGQGESSTTTCTNQASYQGSNESVVV